MLAKCWRRLEKMTKRPSNLWSLRMRKAGSSEHAVFATLPTINPPKTCRTVHRLRSTVTRDSELDKGCRNPSENVTGMYFMCLSETPVLLCFRLDSQRPSSSGALVDVHPTVSTTTEKVANRTERVGFERINGPFPQPRMVSIFKVGTEPLLKQLQALTDCSNLARPSPARTYNHALG